jgi:1-acyl-sn-glycerol-3-phosphate acyltransferase
MQRLAGLRGHAAAPALAPSRRAAAGPPLRRAARPAAPARAAPPPPPRAPLRCRASAVAAAAASAPLADSSFSSGGGLGALLWELFARARALAFAAVTFALAVPLFGAMAAAFPPVYALDRQRRRAEHAFNALWARASTLLFYRVAVEGREHLPPPGEPVVFVANHQSFLDIYTLFHLGRDFKFISKASVFLVPLIGWSMFMTGHVGLKRTDKRSQLECLKACGELLKAGASVLFFPEGTRSADGRMHGFKKGAFSVAAKAGVRVVPLTLVGTGALMPNAREHLLFPGRVRLVVHPPLPAGMAADAAMAAARAVVGSALPPGDVADDEE